MERTATQCITYGLYMLSTVWEKKANGCIIDTMYADQPRAGTDCNCGFQSELYM